MLKLIPLQIYISNMGKKARNAGTKKKYTVEYWNKHPEFRLVEYEKKKFNLSDEDFMNRLKKDYEKFQNKFGGMYLKNLIKCHSNPKEFRKWLDTPLPDKI
tara:strand:- start:2402 stop:2704 length:303 start_codon:yes stop_codon:yes gene_type:complete